MAEIPKHARYARQADFEERLAGGLIDDGTICFIEDTRQIWHHGNYYIEASGGGGPSWVPEPGAYVAYTDADGVNRIAKPSEYSAEGNTPCGVLVVHGGGSLLVSPSIIEDESCILYECKNTDTGGTLTGNLAVALNDTLGERNTALILAAEMAADGYEEDKGFLASAIIHGYQYRNQGGGVWWIPGMGELKIINDYLTEVNEAIRVLSGRIVDDFNCGSSTQASETQMWVWNFDDNTAQMARKGDSVILRPVSRFAWVPDGYSGGGEPAVVEPEPEPEPITVVPDTVLRPYGSGMQEFTLVVTSPTPWAIPIDGYFDGNGGWDNGEIYLPQTSGLAGVTKIQGSGYFGLDRAFANLTFEDELGNSAKVKIDTTEGICVWPEYLEFSEEEGVYNKYFDLYSPTNWTSETEGDTDAFSFDTGDDDAGSFLLCVHCNDLSKDAECVRTYKDENGNTVKLTVRVRN